MPGLSHGLAGKEARNPRMRVFWPTDYHPATPALAATARQVSIYKGQKFSDHAPVTVDYALAL